MQEITVLIALVSSVMVFCLPPLYGLIVYVAALGWYPSYLSVPVGTVDFTVTRIVIMALLANIFIRTKTWPKLNWLDKWVLIFFGCQLVAGATTTELGELIENRAGAAFDFVLPYFAVRWIIKDFYQYTGFLKALVIIAVPLAVVGFYQCITGNNPLGFLKKYYAWTAMEGYVAIQRHGFYRADVTFPMSIMFGLFFSMYGPVVAGLIKNDLGSKIFGYFGFCIMLLGVFDSMSSGPMFGMILAMIFFVIFKYRKYWRSIAGAFACVCFVVEILSNRHFYDVLGSFTLSPQTAWYRSKLIDVALFQGGMSGYWVFGHGFADPGWSLVIDNRDHTDIVNQYLLNLSIYGLVGLVPFLLILYFAIKQLVVAFKQTMADSHKWMIWCIGASLFGSLGAMFTVSLFGQPQTIFFSVLGLCSAMPAIIEQANMTILKKYSRYEERYLSEEYSNQSDIGRHQ